MTAIPDLMTQDWNSASSVNVLNHSPYNGWVQSLHDRTTKQHHTQYVSHLWLSYTYILRVPNRQRCLPFVVATTTTGPEGLFTSEIYHAIAPA